MISRSAEMGQLHKGQGFGKKLCWCGEARVEITMLKRLSVEQGWQCGLASRF